MTSNAMIHRQYPLHLPVLPFRRVRLRSTPPSMPLTFHRDEPNSSLILSRFLSRCTSRLLSLRTSGLGTWSNKSNFSSVEISQQVRHWPRQLCLQRRRHRDDGSQRSRTQLRNSALYDCSSTVAALRSSEISQCPRVVFILDANVTESAPVKTNSPPSCLMSPAPAKLLIPTAFCSHPVMLNVPDSLGEEHERLTTIDEKILLQAG
jgi:hypothetical protein